MNGSQGGWNTAIVTTHVHKSIYVWSYQMLDTRVWITVHISEDFMSDLIFLRMRSLQTITL